MDATSSSPRWRRRKDDRPAEIIAAALDVFAEKGFAAAKLDEIAARAGLSKGSIYLHFADKQDLFRAVVAEAITPNIEAVQAAAEAHQGPFADLARALLPMVAGIATRTPMGGVLKMVIGESRNFPELARVWHDALVARALAIVAGRIAAAQARGEVRAGDT